MRALAELDVDDILQQLKPSHLCSVLKHGGSISIHTIFQFIGSLTVFPCRVKSRSEEAETEYVAIDKKRPEVVLGPSAKLFVYLNAVNCYARNYPYIASLKGNNCTKKETKIGNNFKV